jgi:hypothetical protein
MAVTGGTIAGHFTLDTTVPGWHGAGAVDVARLNLARWLNRADRPSDITGHVTFNLALELGRRFPRGVYTFDGSHAMYLNYEGDNVHARGQITSSEVLISHANAIAYGTAVTTTDGTVASTNRFHSASRARRATSTCAASETVPVPRVVAARARLRRHRPVLAAVHHRPCRLRTIAVPRRRDRAGYRTLRSTLPRSRCILPAMVKSIA